MQRASLILVLFVLCATATKLQRFFSLVDVNQDGYWEASEIKKYTCGTYEDGCRPRQLKMMITTYDLDVDGKISLAEFEAANKEPTDPTSDVPQQVHLSVTNLPTQMVVMWVTKDPVSSTVQYGVQSGGKLSNSASGTIDTYDVGLFGWSGWIHTVLLSNLSPLTTYIYRVGNGSLWSQQFSFTTPPSGPTSTNRVFAVLGDMGTTIPMGWAVTDQITRDNTVTPFSLVLHVGDIAYAGTGSTWEIEDIWDIWGDQVQEIAANVPYMFAVGNHEHYYNYTSYRTRFLMPGKQSGGNGNFWYSINYDQLHLVFMSTEHPYDVGTPQYIWLQEDLAKANSRRNQLPWVIVMGHRPMYCSDSTEYDAHSPGAHFQSVIEPLFLTYAVDLYLSGHMHMYERIYPLKNGTVVETGNVYRDPTFTAHVVQGTGGVFTDPTRDYINPQPVWSAARNDDWGYGRMTVNSTYLHYEFMRWDTLETDDVIDEFVILRTLKL